MNLYSVPLGRTIVGQTRDLSRTPLQRALYYKYATVIKTFLAGITADVLRMRLKQAADVSFMSMKNFLDCKQVNIILALKENRSFLLLVYPPNEVSPDLARWNTRLLCLVLRACNCLSVREQDDVIYVAKMYRRHFSYRQQNIGSSTIPKKGTLAKREWIKVSSAIQRMVEAVNDTGLLKEVRNFICKVEMETRTSRARQEAQIQLETFIAEMIAGNPFSKHRKENMTDEVKQMLSRQTSNLASKRKQTYMQRPKSAGARLTMDRGSTNNLDITENNVPVGNSRPTTADKPNIYPSSQRRKFEMGGIVAGGQPELKISNHIRDIQTKCINVGKGNVSKVGKRPFSATERSMRTTTTLTDKRPQSTLGHKRNVEIKEDESHAADTATADINTSRIRNTPLQREGWSRSDTLKCTGQDNFAQPATSQTDKQVKNEKQNKTYANSRPLLRTYSKRKNLLQQVNSKLKFNVARKNVTRKLKSSGKVNTTRTGNAKDDVIHIPTARETDCVELGDTKHVGNVRHIHHKTARYKEKLKLSEDDNVKADDQQKHTDKDKTLIEKTAEPVKSYPEEIIKADPSKQQRETDKRRVFDNNMKKIANEVLVHQQIHVAAKNPLLQDKEFVDEFFSFLNENHVTKKFLRAQSTESHQSWKLPNGKRASFSFFLAFVFRHIDNKDINMVSYIVEKMLLRMKCKHEMKKCEDSAQENGQMKSCEITNSVDTLNVHTNKRELNSPKTQNLSRGRNVKSERGLRPVSRSLGPTERSKSVSKSRGLSKVGEELPKLYKSTSITDNQCWKCLQKDVAMTACVNWGNRCLCDLLISKGVPYKDEHLSAAVKANDRVTLAKIVQFLKEHSNWNACSKESKDALFLARKHGMRQMVDCLTEEGVKDERIVNRNACTSCFIA